MQRFDVPHLLRDLRSSYAPERNAALRQLLDGAEDLMHQADAGSDAYDRDFALSLLSQEQDALYEIEEALRRIELGSYGVCELCNKNIPHARLEAIPFARFTVDCQSQIEKQRKLNRSRQPVTSLFGLTDEEGGGGEGGGDAGGAGAGEAVSGARGDGGAGAVAGHLVGRRLLSRAR